MGLEVGSRFIANRGVKQGCVLSPLLFNIFLSDLTSEITNENCKPVRLSDNYYISSLIWADDVLLLSETEDGLDCMLKTLSKYVEKNKMEINTNKTKCMVFNKSGKFYRRCFKINKGVISTTNKYKYLGFIVTPSGEITTGLKDLKDRALNAYYSLKNKMGQYFRLNTDTTLHLFDSLIKPILLYNSDFWGCLKIPKNNPIENVHMRFCKELLGVQKQTTNIGILLELGRVPLTLFAKKNCIKNWGRINTGNANKVLLSIIKMSIDDSLNWTNTIIDCVNKTGVGIRYNKSIHEKAFRRMWDIFHQESFVEIGKESSKLRTYGLLKTKIGREKYLVNITNLNDRTAISKIRLSNHNLMIEKGRHLKIAKDKRYCPFCPGAVETEKHFLLFCKSFAIARHTLISRVEKVIGGFKNCDDATKFKILLSNDRALPMTGTYLFKSLYTRNFLSQNPKNSE